MKLKLFLLNLFLLALAVNAFSQTKTPAFRQYSVRVEKIKNIEVNLKSHKNANMFRTNLRNAAKKGVNFAGHFVFTSWGCGTNCYEAAIIDARTGRVFFPKEFAGAGFGFCDFPDDAEPQVFRADSRLLILNGFKGGDLEKENSPCGVYYLEWTGTAFRQVKFIRKKRTDTP